MQHRGRPKGADELQETRTAITMQLALRYLSSGYVEVGVVRLSQLDEFTVRGHERWTRVVDAWSNSNHRVRMNGVDSSCPALDTGRWVRMQDQSSYSGCFQLIRQREQGPQKKCSYEYPSAVSPPCAKSPTRRLPRSPQPKCDPECCSSNARRKGEPKGNRNQREKRYRQFSIQPSRSHGSKHQEQAHAQVIASHVGVEK